MSKRRFEGWTPRTWTTYHRDANGDIVSATTVTESEWDDVQRGWMLALAAWRESRCSGCGGDLAETTDPANEERYHTEVLRCHKCTARSIAAAPFQDREARVTAPEALLYVTKLRT